MVNRIVVFVLFIASLAGCAQTGETTTIEARAEVIEETADYYIMRVSCDTTKVPKMFCYGDCDESQEENLPDPE